MLPVPGKFHFPGLRERAAKHRISSPMRKCESWGQEDRRAERCLRSLKVQFTNYDDIVPDHIM